MWYEDGDLGEEQVRTESYLINTCTSKMKVTRPE